MKYFIVTIFLLPAVLMAQPGSDAEFSQKFRLASVYENTHDYANAIRLYEDLYKLRPDDPNISTGYIRSLYALKRFAEVEKVLDEVVKNNPANSFDLYLMLGRTRAQLNKKSEALDAFEKAESSAPESDQYSVTIAIANVMVESGYDEEALELLQNHRKSGEQSADFFTPEIARLLYKLGKYDAGTKEYLSMIRSNEANLAVVQMRIAQFTADSTVRRTIIKSVISQVDTETASISELRLLGWSYGELRDYPNALTSYLIIEGRTGKKGNPMAGFELMQFADRALAEGAYETAAVAYDEAAKRMKGEGMRQPLSQNAELGSLKARQAQLTKQVQPRPENVKALITRYRAFAATAAAPDVALGALWQAGELALKQLHDREEAKNIFEQIIARQRLLSDQSRNAYFMLEEIALANANTVEAREYLDQLDKAILKNPRIDEEIRRHITFERARIDYFEGSFDSAISTLADILTVPTSDYANDAIALNNLITENLKGTSDAALRVFSKSELLSLGSDLNSAYSGYLSIRQTYPKTAVADEATLRAADLLVVMSKPQEAVALLEKMQEESIESPILDQAAFREAEITQHELADREKALKLYEDFLARFPKSPLCTEVRQQARKLRGDAF